MSRTLGLLVVLAAVLVQVSVLPAFSIFGAHPNLVLVLIVSWIAVRGQREAFLLVPAAGIAQGLLDSSPLGLTLLALAPLILLSDLRELHLVESDFLPAVVLTAAGTLAFEGVFLLTLAVTGERVDFASSALDVLAPAVIANMLLLPLLYALVWLGSGDLRGRRAF